MARIGFSASPRSWSRYPADHPVLLEGNGLVYIELRPDLDYETIRGQTGVPTLVTQGLFRGFILPEYVADSGEELFATICVPNRYDEESDIFVHLYCWLAIAEDTRNFNLELGWEHYTPGTDIVPATETLVPVQTATGVSAAQFQSYKVAFTLAYGDIIANDVLALRLRRIEATPNDCLGNIVVNHYGVIFRRNKLGTPAV